MSKTIIAALAAATLAAGVPASAHEDVTVGGPQGALAGTFVAPGDGQPVILFIAGSGPTDRDGNNPMGVNAAPYRMLGDALATRGIGSLRADKRGLFASKDAVADPNDVRIADYVADADAWAAMLREKTGNNCVWLLGHSEGGVVALAAAQQLDGLCGVILVAAPGRPIGTVLREQLQANPANAPVLDAALAAIDKLEAGERVDTTGMHPGLLPLFNDKVQGFLGDLMSHDPAAMAARVTLPMLIVQGGKDIQVAVADGEALLAAQPEADMVVLADMNHVLKDVETDDRMANMMAYANPDLPLADGLVQAIATFVGHDTPAE